MRRRRLAALFPLLAVLAVALGALAALAERDAAPPPAPATPVQQAVAAPTATPTAAPPRKRAAKRRRPRLPGGRSVRAALRRALLTRAIDRRHYRRWRASTWRARRALRTLPAARRAELASAVGTLDALAAAGRLTASRMPLAFLTLRRNTELWTRRPFPHPKQRTTFGSDPAVFQYYPGHGIQHHPLATAGRINALVQPCLRAHAARERRRLARARRAAVGRRTGQAPARARRSVAATPSCHERRLRRSLDRLAGLATRRGGFAAWEYLFQYGPGAPPWISGMAQATAAQALARGAVALDVPRYRRLAVDALGAFEAVPPLGVAVRAGTGRHYAMYSFDPGLRILNGFLQSVIGLHDVAELTGSARAARLYRLGERTARVSVRGYDTGAWSLYSAAGRESPLDYHELVTAFLAGMCTRTSDAHYCAPARRFTRYMHEPPELTIAQPSATRAGRATRVRFRVSKVSAVRITVLRRGTPVVRRALRLPRGSGTTGWIPARAGRYTVRVQATGPEGRTATERAAVRVRPRLEVARRRAAARRARARAERRATLRRAAARLRAAQGG